MLVIFGPRTDIRDLRVPGGTISSRNICTSARLDQPSGSSRVGSSPCLGALHVRTNTYTTSWSMVWVMNLLRMKSHFPTNSCAEALYNAICIMLKQQDSNKPNQSLKTSSAIQSSASDKYKKADSSETSDKILLRSSAMDGQKVKSNTAIQRQL